MLRPIFKFLIILVVFSTIAGLSAFFTLSFFIKSEETVIVPDLEGKDAIFALQFLGGMELNTRVRGFEYDDDIPKNHVIQQSPEPGRMIKKGRDVSLLLSRGSPMVTVPDLKGRNVSQALLIVEENGLAKGHQSFVYSGDAAQDTVLAQHPPPGKSVKRSNSVDLLISRGVRPAAYQMPDLKGRYLDESMQLIDRYNLMLESATTEYDESKPENTVLRQDPPAGHYIEEDSHVALTVNRKAKKEKNGSTDTGRLFTYQIPHGYLNQHVRLELSIYGMTVTIYDGLMKPGKEIWTIVPEHAQAVLFLYLNNELAASEIYN